MRLLLDNESAMFHPMHLHGHTLAVVQDGRPWVRKDTVNVLPGQRVDADLVANNPDKVSKAPSHGLCGTAAEAVIPRHASTS